MTTIGLIMKHVSAGEIIRNFEGRQNSKCRSNHSDARNCASKTNTFENFSPNFSAYSSSWWECCSYFLLNIF